MTRVDFYVLPESEGGNPNDAALTACKLCDKAASAGKRIYVNVPDPAEQEALDKLLWTFRQGSFIAHERHDGQPPSEPLPMVLLGAGEPPATHRDVLINLGDGVPDCFSRFERVCEIVAGDSAERTRSRERFKFYRDRGYDLKSYEQQPDGSWKARRSA